MPGLAPSQTVALSEMALDDLTPTGKKKKTQTQTNHGHSQYAVHGIAPSISESYDAEIGIAQAERLKKFGPEAPLQAKYGHFVSTIANYKLARWSFCVALVVFVTSICYEVFSLVPSYLGYHVQMRSEADARQGTIRGFVQECLTRKVQMLPLGADCLKYLMKTPKAPPDIDKYMVDSPNSTSTESVINMRYLSLEPRQVGLNANFNSFSNLELPAEMHVNHLPYIFIVILSLGAVILLLYLSPKIRRLFVIICDQHSRLVLKIMGHYMRFMMHSPTTLLFACGWSGLIIWSIWNYYHDWKRWNVTAEFLATCNIQKDYNLPLGDDCAKYLEKELKPAPQLRKEEIVCLALVVLASLMALAAWYGRRKKLANEAPDLPTYEIQYMHRSEQNSDTLVIDRFIRMFEASSLEIVQGDGARIDVQLLTPLRPGEHTADTSGT